MIQLVCPNCGHRFPILPLGSTGNCVCGLDYDATLNGATLRLKWTPDPKYPQSGTRSYFESFPMTP